MCKWFSVAVVMLLLIIPNNCFATYFDGVKLDNGYYKNTKVTKMNGVDVHFYGYDSVCATDHSIDTTVDTWTYNNKSYQFDATSVEDIHIEYRPTAIGDSPFCRGILADNPNQDITKIYNWSVWSALLLEAGSVHNNNTQSSYTYNTQSSYTFKLNCVGGKRGISLHVESERASVSPPSTANENTRLSGKEFLLNGIPPTYYYPALGGWDWVGELSWDIPIDKGCGESVTIVPSFINPDFIGSATINVVRAIFSSCNLHITNFQGTVTKLDPSSGGNVPFTGNISDDPSKSITWTITLPDGTTTSGSGTAPSATWDGTDANFKVVDPGSYTATLAASDGQCNDTQNATVNVQWNAQCALDVTLGSSANVASGNLFNSQSLFSTNGTGLAANISLYYNSLDSHSASLGTGWSHSYDISLKQNSNGSVVLHEGSGKRKLYTLSNGVYASQPGDYATLVKNSNGTFTLTQKDGTKYNFTAGGSISSMADRNGNTISFAYAGGNLTTITDPAGRITTLTYDAANHATSIIDPSGNAYTFAYSGNTLSSVTYPDGGSWHYTYDAKAFMLAKTDPLGNITTYSYDAKHRVASATDPEGKTRSVTYPQPGTDVAKTTTFTEKDGGVWTYRYDTQAGTLTSKIDPQGGITGYTYDASGNRLSSTAPDGTTASYIYDNQGNMTSTTDALGQTTSYAYNGFGQVLSIKDPQGNTTSYTYDATGNMITMTDSAGATTQYQYDAKGNVTKITNPLGQATILTYDAKGNLAFFTDPTGATTSYTYDAAGNVTSQTDAAGNTTQFVYDARNRLIKVTDPQGNVTTYTYDANGNKTSQTDANGNTTYYEYNYKGQLIKVRDSLGNVTIYAYGTTGCPSCGGGTDKLTGITDANVNVTSYQYDTLGRLVSETDPLGNNTAYSYDANSKLTAKTDANGATTKFTYDSLGRLLKKSYPDATATTFTYDAMGNVATAANQDISYIFNYDANGRITKVADTNGKAISYVYDKLGNRISMVAPNGTTRYTYDADNRLTGISNGGTFTIGYDTKGERTSLTYPNGDTTTYSYEKDGRLTNLVHKNAAGTIIASNSYALDKIGNRMSNSSQDNTISYQYDAIYQLTQALSSTPGYSSNSNGKGSGIPNATQQQKEFFSYDPVGNRLTSDKTKTYVYNQANQLVINGGSYAYDKNGNLTSKTTADGTTAYVWDYENRLIKVTNPDGSVSEFAYDPFGRRIEKMVTESGATTTNRYFYDNNNILFEYDENGNIGNSYTHGPGIDEHLMVANGKDKYYYHADGLGSVIALTDTAGKVIQSYEYDSFGNLKDQKNRIKQPYTYTGREWDKETGLYYYRARYYDPMEGRFISKDPIAILGNNYNNSYNVTFNQYVDAVQNSYAYVQNNPVNLIDPFGLTPLDPATGKPNPNLNCHVCSHDDPRENLKCAIGAGTIVGGLVGGVYVAGSPEAQAFLSGRAYSSGSKGAMPILGTAIAEAVAIANEMKKNKTISDAFYREEYNCLCQ